VRKAKDTMEDSLLNTSYS